MMEVHRAIVLQDHLPVLADALAWVILAIELFGALILFVGLGRFVLAYVGSELAGGSGPERHSRANLGRILLARYILMALEVFIVADLLMILLSMSMQNLLFLGLLVLIRSVVSYFLEHELKAIREDGKP
ncbi:MAG: DUF1622 domain-containing protein [Pararhodobacter sp.]|nr:DUF1622 domain-containing protein [Pararhodobacter sp.]